MHRWCYRQDCVRCGLRLVGMRLGDTSRLGAGEPSGLGSACSLFGLHPARRLPAAQRLKPWSAAFPPHGWAGVEHEGQLLYEGPQRACWHH
jgi:hypothetical protein